VWESLAKIRVPTLIVRGLKSDRWPPEILARVQRDFPKFEWATADSFHDVAYYAPAELVAAVRKFVG
jgi:pimeloyl-ACP methyl ester carboxylesterase